MPDREKVIDSLYDSIKNLNVGFIDGVGDMYAVSEETINDAIILLKEQEAEWVYGEDETGVDGWHCSECGFFEPWFYDYDDDIDFIKCYEHCPKCGRRMISHTGKQEGR